MLKAVSISITSGTIVNFVTNSDGSLTVSPTSGNVVVSLNTGHTNTFTVPEYFANGTDAAPGVAFAGNHTSGLSLTSAGGGVDTSVNGIPQFRVASSFISTCGALQVGAFNNASGQNGGRIIVFSGPNGDGSITGADIFGGTLNIGGGALTIDANGNLLINGGLITLSDDGSVVFANNGMAGNTFGIDANGNISANGGQANFNENGTGTLASGGINWDTNGQFFALNLSAGSTVTAGEQLVVGGAIPYAVASIYDPNTGQTLYMGRSSGTAGNFNLSTDSGELAIGAGNGAVGTSADGILGVYAADGNEYIRLDTTGSTGLVTIGDNFGGSTGALVVGQLGQDCSAHFSNALGLFAAIGDTQQSSSGCRLQIFGGAGYGYFDGPIGFGSNSSPTFPVDVTGGVNVSDNFYINGTPIAGVITSSDSSLTVSGSDIVLNTSHSNTWLVNQVFASIVTFSGVTTFNQNMNITPSGHSVTVSDITSFTLGTSSGTKWGTGTTQKQAWWNATPIVQPVNTTAIDTLLTNTGLRASGGVANFDTIIKPRAGSATAGTAPIQFTTGVNLTTPVAGAMEYVNPDLFFTPNSAVRYNVPLVSGAGTQGDLLYASGASIYARLAKDTNTSRYLSNSGTANSPSWSQVDLTTGVTGVLPAANGGIPSTFGRATGQTSANASVVTKTVGAADASFMVSANVLVTASTLNSFTVTCAYTDESNTPRTLTLNFSQLTGAFITTITNATGAAPYEGVPVQIRCKAATTITIASTGTFTTVTYNIEGLIRQLT